MPFLPSINLQISGDMFLWLISAIFHYPGIFPRLRGLISLSAMSSKYTL